MTSASPTIFNLTMYSNSYFSLGEDEAYDFVVYNFYKGKTIGYFSASTIGNLSGSTIGNFVRTYVG